MKILVLGATGKVGSRTVDEALAAGHQVIAFVRRPDAVVMKNGLTVVQGEATDISALAQAATGVDSVIVSITGSTKDTTFMQRTLPKIIEAVKQAGVSRLIVVSAFGAGDTAEKASGFARLIYRSVLKKFLDDKAASEQLLPGAGIDYTIVYPVNLKDAPAVPNAVVKEIDRVGKVPGLPTLPFENAAKALVEIVDKPEFSKKRVLVTTAKGWRAP